MINDIVGQKFGRLTVIEDSGKRHKDYEVLWVCICSCGTKKEIRGDHLKSGNTKSCGCLRKEKNVFLFKHGDAKKIKGLRVVRLYRIWNGMKARCLIKNHPQYHRYGGRAIRICRLWLNNYMAFKTWALSHGYQENLTIDRINNNGNYTPENCQWITKSENTRKSNKILSKKI
jgi:hypothetical protein